MDQSWDFWVKRALFWALSWTLSFLLSRFLHIHLKKIIYPLWEMMDYILWKLRFLILEYLTTIIEDNGNPYCKVRGSDQLYGIKEQSKGCAEIPLMIMQKLGVDGSGTINTVSCFQKLGVSFDMNKARWLSSSSGLETNPYTEYKGIKDYDQHVGTLVLYSRPQLLMKTQSCTKSKIGSPTDDDSLRNLLMRNPYILDNSLGQTVMAFMNEEPDRHQHVWILCLGYGGGERIYENEIQHILDLERCNIEIAQHWCIRHHLNPNLGVGLVWMRADHGFGDFPWPGRLTIHYGYGNAFHLAPPLDWSGLQLILITEPSRYAGRFIGDMDVNDINVAFQQMDQDHEVIDVNENLDLD